MYVQGGYLTIKYIDKIITRDISVLEQAGLTIENSYIIRKANLKSKSLHNGRDSKNLR